MDMFVILLDDDRILTTKIFFFLVLNPLFIIHVILIPVSEVLYYISQSIMLSVTDLNLEIDEMGV